jgi:hypothetical protein
VTKLEISLAVIIMLLLGGVIINRSTVKEDSIRAVIDPTTKKLLKCATSSSDSIDRFILLKGDYIVCDKYPLKKIHQIDYKNLTPQQKADTTALRVINN